MCKKLLFSLGKLKILLWKEAKGPIWIRPELWVIALLWVIVYNSSAKRTLGKDAFSSHLQPCLLKFFVFRKGLSIMETISWHLSALVCSDLFNILSRHLNLTIKIAEELCQFKRHRIRTLMCHMCTFLYNECEQSSLNVLMQMNFLNLNIAPSALDCFFFCCILLKLNEHLLLLLLYLL